VQEITLDGGKVRLRNEDRGKPCYWKDYKALCLDNVYCELFFQSDQALIDWTNSQKLLHPIYCIGDGHAGIWNLFQEIGVSEQTILRTVLEQGRSPNRDKKSLEF